MGPPEKESPTPDQLGGETGNRARECNPHHLMGEAGRRLTRYGTAKFHTLAALDAVGDSAAQKAGMRVEKIRACGDWLKFRHFPTLGATHLHSANFCCVNNKTTQLAPSPTTTGRLSVRRTSM